MKKFLTLLTLSVLLFLGYNSISKPLKLVVITDTSKKLSPAKKIIPDTMFFKTIVLSTNKSEEKSFAEKYSTLIIVLTGFLGAFFAFRYSIKQNISNTRLSWIRDFRLLVSDFMTAALKLSIEKEIFQITVKRYVAANDQMQKEQDQVMKQPESVVDELKLSTGELEAKLVEILKRQNQLAEIQKRLDDNTVVFLGKSDKFSENVVYLYKTLTQVSFALDRVTYPKTQGLLANKISEYCNHLYQSDKIIDIYKISSDKLISEIQELIDAVIIEQWKLAQGF